MNNFKHHLKTHPWIYIYLSLYFLASAFLLTRFPTMHSDEPWLGALSRSMLMQGDYGVTEPFFDVYSRNPHAIRLLFHGLQSMVIHFFGFGLYPLRMISLVFGLGTLGMAYAIGFNILQNQKKALLITLILSLDIWFIYASHFARQEIILVFLLLTAVALLLKDPPHHTWRRDVLVGVILGLAIGVHPNCFLLSLVLGSMYLYFIYKKELQWKNLWILMGVVAVFALIFVALSFSFDPNYIQNYLQSGRKFGVHRSLLEKFGALGTFFADLWQGKGLTYYIPDIRITLTLFILTILLSLGTILKKRPGSKQKYTILFSLATAAILLGLVLIGRFNPTSVVFLFPFLYLLAGLIVLDRFGSKGVLLLLIPILVNLWINAPDPSSTYAQYETQVAAYVDPDDKSLANLNLGFYFEEGSLLDYRNLRYYREAGLTLEEYITTREIEYILYSDELDAINDKKPAYNTVYGNPDFYYDELKIFLQDHCQLVGSFENPTYGTHIANWMDQRPWQISVFKVTTTP
ncbi:glycosyltransferase family 39 protein [Alkalibacter rhizosphaerae]|uniref:Glycosyltransferase family 39 protein n=1 Tax=Alkalibacter rhizosphaerae TaxID=2815577 RepID=A0A974XII8_9FIRM|nr:glycosyltransferase family 39 protein [Alkalibacter rhizosphaerae]QSX09390.1 glycosyltransferase family 39 protein [Alkalibacter rhizosphaerae]